VPTVLNAEAKKIIATSSNYGWILEPDAKRILDLSGIKVPRFEQALTVQAAVRAAEAIGYPVVLKVVSPEVVHKTDSGGVAVGIRDRSALESEFNRFQGMPGFMSMLIEEMVSGVELIVGAQYDFQFGPVILIGIGGTGVEIYQDTALRMAPLTTRDVDSMLNGLKGGKLLEGYRGQPAVNRKAFNRLLLQFSDLVMDLDGQVASIDLNPVMCSAGACIVADARIMLTP
jgi:hypothetical protein